MFKLRYGYLFVGIIMGLVLLWQFFISLPDGKMHITICDVGQGDSSYLLFPDGRDMVVDGGPSSQVLSCLGKKMPFWDRYIDAVILTHPDQDHFKGLIDIVQRYQIGVFIHPDVTSTAPLYRELLEKIVAKHIPVKTVTAYESIHLEKVTLDVLWPAQAFLSQTNNVLSASSDAGETAVEMHRNDYGIVFHLRYGMFDAVFTADTDERVEPYFAGQYLTPDGVDLLKVPHHGSKTGMTEDFLSWIHPRYAVISVGNRNTYGHPAPQTLEQLKNVGATIFRTDRNGSVTVVTDGRTMKIETEK